MQKIQFSGSRLLCNMLCGLSLSLGALSPALVAAQASDFDPLYTTGVGQDSPGTPIQLRNFRLDDPLVQQKYLNSPDMLRFLRGTYSQACVRGLLNESAKNVKANLERKFSKEQVNSASMVLEANQIWKLNTLELDHYFGNGYIHGAYYCDCLMKELTDADLIDPAKSVEITSELPLSTQATCERLAAEKTERYAKRHPRQKRQNKP